MTDGEALTYRPNARVNVRVKRIGLERAPVVVIDDFLANAHELVEHAAVAGGFRAVAGNLYPGIRAPLPRAYMRLLFMCLPELVLKEFGIAGLDTSRIEGDYSIVTTLPCELQLMQCMPHIDTLNPSQIASLHYLCGPEHGGTSFYRHRRTGFESVTPERGGAYQAAIQADLREHGPPERVYINGNSALFERIDGIDAAFNRLVLYRSAVLHSGSIASDYAFDANPRTGRLTANAFLHFGVRRTER